LTDTTDKAAATEAAADKADIHTTQQLDTLKATTATSVTVAAKLTGFAAMKAVKAKFVDEFKEGELLVPWLRIVQGTSSFRKKNMPEYVEGAEEGDIIDTVSRRLRATQEVVFVKYEKHYTTWKPGGGKIVKQWFADPSGYEAATYPDPDKKYGNKIDADGNEIAETPTYYILAVDSKTGACTPMTMAWGSTQAKKTRRLNALATADLADPETGEVEPRIMFATVFDIGTVHETGNDKSWYGWTFNPGPLTWDIPKYGLAWFGRAAKFRKDIEDGLVRPQPPVEADEANARTETYEGGQRQSYGNIGRSGGSAPATDQGELDSDIPF
jgi:hypothetical protein